MIRAVATERSLYAIFEPNPPFVIEEGDDILRFEETEKPGQAAMVPWIIAHRRDGSVREFNVAMLHYIDREPDL